MKNSLSTLLNKQTELKSKINLLQPSILSDEWNREVFRNHNMEYGAYQIRIHYQQNISKALLISFTVVLLFVISVLFISKSDKIIARTMAPVLTIDPGIIICPPQPKKIIEPKVSKPYFENATVIITNDTTSEKQHNVKQVTNQTTGTGTDSSASQNYKTGNGKVTGTGFVNGSIEIKKDSAVNWVPEMPEFPGGLDALNKYISKKIKTNSQWRESGFDGKVVYEFVVGRDGKIRDIKIMRDGVNYGIAELNLPIFENMPVWKPGKNNGFAVSVLYRIPIKFVKE